MNICKHAIEFCRLYETLWQVTRRLIGTFSLQNENLCITSNLERKTFNKAHSFCETYVGHKKQIQPGPTQTCFAGFEFRAPVVELRSFTDFWTSVTTGRWLVFFVSDSWKSRQWWMLPLRRFSVLQLVCFINFLDQNNENVQWVTTRKVKVTLS